MKKPLHFAHELVQAVVKKGDHVVDATCGNGHDTAFLADLVGAEGQVYGFDIQPQALAAANKRLLAGNLLKQVELLEASHAEISKWPPGPLAAVMFNLGYLPGGDHALVTKPDTTVSALQIAVERLKRGGIITIMVYTGHPGGQEEYRAVRNYCRSLPQQAYTVLELSLIHICYHPPLLLAISCM